MSGVLWLAVAGEVLAAVVIIGRTVVCLRRLKEHQ
jgi:hypothetical protein